MKTMGSMPLIEVECPMCGELCYVPEEEFDSMIDKDEEYACSGCGYVDQAAEWPYQEYGEGIIMFVNGIAKVVES